MIPAWKLRRELLRLTQQIIGLPGYLRALPARLNEPARRAAYERDFDKVTQLDEGAVPFGKKPAIYLIYQPNGIAKSSLAALDWLTAHGYSPIVVSNSPVQEQDVPDILQRSSLLLRRPNFGYDFGGYKDGIKLINRQSLTPERVIIMNDSVWLPMVPDLMDRLEQREDADILGLLEDEKIIHEKDGGRPSGLKHVESYFYLISAKAWRSEAFQKFWRDYEMTSSKSDTIKIGEIGFSHKMRKAGLSTGSLSSRAKFLDELSKKDIDFLKTTLNYASYDDKYLKRQGEDLLAANIFDNNWHREALQYIKKCVDRKGFNSTFPFANDKIFGTLFMKKNRDALFREMRINYLKAVSDKALLPPPDLFISEIQDMVSKQQGKV